MKWTAISVAALAAWFEAVDASPMDKRQNIPTYRLRVSQPDAPTLDGAYLSISPESTIGVFTTAEDSPNPYFGAIELYVLPGVSKGTFEMHTYPIGIVDHALGLVGTTGLMAFTDITNPAATTYPVGTTAVWTEWGMDNMAFESGDDEASLGKRSCRPTMMVDRENQVYYAGEGAGNKYAGWQMFPQGADGDWQLFWNNGSAITTQNYIRVEVAWESTEVCPYEE